MGSSGIAATTGLSQSWHEKSQVPIGLVHDFSDSPAGSDKSMSSPERLEEAHSTFAELTAAFEDTAIAAAAQAVRSLIDARRQHAKLTYACEYISSVLLRLQDLLQ